MRRRQTTDSEYPGRYMTPAQRAAYLNVCLRTFRTVLSRREIPYIQFNGKGSLVRIDRQDLDEFMQKNKVSA
jgi:excisionase family DNA binding protein